MPGNWLRPQPSHCSFARTFVQEISLKHALLPALLPACAFLALPLLTSSTLAQARVTDPAAPVPPVVYQSVFADTPKGVEMQTADWKKANAEVGQFTRGHVDILKWEEAQIAKPVPKPEQAPTQPTAPNMHKH